MRGGVEVVARAERAHVCTAYVLCSRARPFSYTDGMHVLNKDFAASFMFLTALYAASVS